MSEYKPLYIILHGGIPYEGYSTNGMCVAFGQIQLEEAVGRMLQEPATDDLEIYEAAEDGSTSLVATAERVSTVRPESIVWLLGDGDARR